MIAFRSNLEITFFLCLTFKSLFRVSLQLQLQIFTFFISFNKMFQISISLVSFGQSGSSLDHCTSIPSVSPSTMLHELLPSAAESRSSPSVTIAFLTTSASRLCLFASTDSSRYTRPEVAQMSGSNHAFTFCNSHHLLVLATDLLAQASHLTFSSASTPENAPRTSRSICSRISLDS
jgi:hypothetical protein